MVPGTPRIAVGSFPETPAPVRRRPQNPGRSNLSQSTTLPSTPGRAENNPLLKSESKADVKKTPKPLPTRNGPGRRPQQALGPVIPVDIIDAPTQRLYAIIFFLGLQLWKMRDAHALYSGAEDDSISELTFMLKWVAFDGMFLWLLPWLRIPWLTYAPVSTLLQIAGFAVADIAIGSRIGLGLFSFGAFWKVVYDRELSISENKVKWSDILNNASHIQGKYTVKILPEGSAKFNPNKQCFCLNSTNPTIHIPIRINGTTPLNMQVLRTDPVTSQPHIIDVKDRETKRMVRSAIRDEDDPEISYMQFPVKEPGLYRLMRIKDITGLDVKIYRSEALIVTCPKAKIVAPSNSAMNRCTGDLSDFALSVEGLAPLKVKYGRNIIHKSMKGKPTVFSVQSVQPENFESPFLGIADKSRLVEDEGAPIPWAASQTISIPLNESLATEGEWVYSVDEVEDACGNVISYSRALDEGDRSVTKKNNEGIFHTFNVHNRPRVSYDMCDPQSPLDLAKGKTGSLPIRISNGIVDPPYEIEYQYMEGESPETSTAELGRPQTKKATIKSASDAITIKTPGLYSLKSISSKYCVGEVMEPSSCLVLTPPEPSLSITHDEILDKCTASSIGLTIDLTLVGTPPFNLRYRVIKDKANTINKSIRIDRTRHQLRFTPEEAGHYVYEFYSLDDKTYDGVQLDHKVLRAEQTVKPLAGASFVDTIVKKPCIDESVEYKVKMIGTPPWKLNYDLIYNGKRTRFTDSDIMEPIHSIKTPVLTKGGKYSLALATVEDVNGCKIFLESEVQIDVKFAKPTAKFAPVEGKLSVLALEGKSVRLPVRLSGEGPWTVKVKNYNEKEQTMTFRHENAELMVNHEGHYELLEVRDGYCPGIVEEKGKGFDVKWISRPTLRIADSPATSAEGDIFVRKDVCEGDEDSIELAFTGTAPFQFAYEHTYKSEGKGKRATTELDNSGDITAALALSAIRMDTTKAGLHTYKFTKISDGLYDNPRDSLLKKPVVLTQRVNPRPSSSFGEVNKMYKYCLDATAGDEVIPIHLHGEAPFAVTINIKHFSTGKSDVINVPFVESNLLNFKIPSHALTLGQHAVSVLKVKDARGCIRKTSHDAPYVIVGVADMPKLAPLEPSQTDYCVGDRIGFNLQGVPPFSVEYEFNGQLSKASTQANFVRVAHSPGNFTITGLMDSASECKVQLSQTKIIHEVPSVRIGGGTTVVEGIHEGDQAEIKFSFHGTPPFTFTYTRSEPTGRGGKLKVVEQHSQTTYEKEFRMFVSLGGTYEVSSIEDKYCSYPPVNRR